MRKSNVVNGYYNPNPPDSVSHVKMGFELAGLCLTFLIFFLLAGCSKEIEIPEAIQVSRSMLSEKIDYNLHIKPILSDRCFKCHGPDKSKVESGLQLTSIDGATLRLESGLQAIVPGDLQKSELVRRILSDDPEEQMPPPESHLSLSDVEKAMLIQWIDEGARYKEHWSLAKITKPRVPSVGKTWLARMGFTDDDETRWVQNEIDHFVLEKLKKKGFQISPRAEPATLLRRVYMDLTGLPPSAQEVIDFLADTSDNAYEKAVDRLLQSPHFGEHLATAWLDLARYADTHGYQDDGMRNAYPYRDWVVRAFNKNLPFDQFVTYQLAGDLLPRPTKDQLIATSFNRQHPQSQEGGIVAEEYLNEYVADRTNTFGKAFLGLTMECARCHDHKYDPISARDYYSLYAFFNQNKEDGVVPYSGEASPTLMLPDEETANKVKYIREEISAVSENLKLENDIYKDGFERFLERISNDSIDTQILKRDLLVHLDFEKKEKDRYRNTIGNDITSDLSGDRDKKPSEVKGRFGTAIQFNGDCGIQLLSTADKEAKTNRDRHYKGLNFERNQPFSFSVWFNVLEDKISGPLINKNNGEFEGYRGYDLALNPDRTLTFRMMYVYPANGIELRTRQKLEVDTWHHIAFTYDGSGTAKGCKIFVDGNEVDTKVIADNLTKSILYDQFGTNWSFMPFEIGKNFLTTIEKVQVDELRIYKRKLSALEMEAIFRNKDVVTLNGSLAKLYEMYLWNYDSTYARNLDRITALRLEETMTVTPVPEVMVMKELPEDQKRKTYIFDRGVYDSPTEEVTAETPLKIGKLPEEYPRNRLGLANWVLHPDNPLFARVMVNRFWIQFFGNGLVKTQEDFGNQGDLPSHPELLDWLAVQFREDSWNTKKFLKRILMSSTYKQSSVATETMREEDPDNKWLSRGPSYQYSAEQVRDNALAASGLLVRKIGGPSVYPYQPSGIWEALATRNAVSYKQQSGDSLYRRSMYTVWKRSSPPPMMLNFDAADRQVCAVRRQRTATPLQSLVTMNDPQFVEAARVLAERTIRFTENPDERITWFFLSIVSRKPRQEELKIMQELLSKELKHFQDHPQLANELRRTGEYPFDERADPAEVAAYTVAANTIMNFDEALVKR